MLRGKVPRSKHSAGKLSFLTDHSGWKDIRRERRLQRCPSQPQPVGAIRNPRIPHPKITEISGNQAKRVILKPGKGEDAKEQVHDHNGSRGLSVD